MNIIIFLIIGLVIIFLFRKKIADRFIKIKKQKEKILIEDTLKHLYDGEYNSYFCTVDSISKNLSLKREDVKKLIERLEELNLIKSKEGIISLTDNGRDNALRVIRIHRLLERYFAEKTSIDGTQWHKLAEEKEHEIKIEEANKIAVELGNPLIDPHGDPIPTENGIIHKEKSKLLNELKENSFAQIIHIEDEPKEIFSALNTYRIYPGMQLHVLKNSGNDILIETEGRKILLNLKEAKNISVKEIEEEVFVQESIKPLSELRVGETAVISSLSGALRGQQRRRLLDLGIVPGTKIKAVLESIGRDPVAYEVRDTLIALRKNQSDYIFVKEVN